ncbi:MAG: hypothetical protein JST04_13140 [Bdellovibrionales bacterium]|nr:hypothetical protein [Bdellovibrionales bacterium]
MKTSLNSKILILSMSALVAFVGCERRGRAPAKGAVAAGGGLSNPTNPTNPIVPNSQPSGTPSSTPVADDAAAVDAKLLAAAQMTDCKIAAIDLKVAGTKDSFLGDLKLIKDFRDGCMAKAGLVFVCKDKAGADCTKDTENADRQWSIDTSATGPAQLEFNRLAKDSDSDKALDVMKARIDLSISRMNKLGAKYDDKALSAAGLSAKDVLTDPNTQANVSIGGSLSDVAAGSAAVDASRKDISGFRADLSE